MGLFRDLNDRGLWLSYSRYVVAMEPIFEQTTERGMHVSVERHAEVAAQLDATLAHLSGVMQELVPEEAKPFRLLKRLPKDMTGVKALSGKEWVRVLPFKDSNQQLIKYMWYKRHQVPIHWKRKRETTEQDELKRLYKKTGDPLYRCVLEYRDAKTVRTNHIKNWTPCTRTKHQYEYEPREFCSVWDTDTCSKGFPKCAGGRIHPIFYNTSTGQMEARRPNTMNAPHHKPEQSDLFRSIVVAEPDHTLLEFDYKSFHALYLAWESHDKVMERVARIDLVSYATAHFLGLPNSDRALEWADDDLAEWLKGVKRDYRQVRDAKMKHAFHGYDNGMRARGCYLRYRDYFENEREVKRCLDVLDRIFSVANKFRTAQQEQAHEQGYLISRFGTIRYFWEVKKYEGNDKWSHGDDAEAAASFVQQTCAHCHLKDAMLRLDADGWLSKAGFWTPEHDNLKFHCPDSLVDEATAYIRQTMESVNPTSGLNVKVEAKRGQSWNKMMTIGE